MTDIPQWEAARKRFGGKRGQTKHAASEASMGGTPQINSGRFWHSKRDRKKYDYLFENRQTDGKTITINAEELGKITRESMFEHSLPGMRLDFTKYHEDWILQRRIDFEAMNERILQLEGLLDEYGRNT